MSPGGEGGADQGSAGQGGADQGSADEGRGGPAGADEDDDRTRVTVRGIYATALTRLCTEVDRLMVVGASEPIRERFDTAFPVAPADATVSTTDDRQGLGVVGNGAAVRTVVARARSVGRDALGWRDPTPRGAVYAGEVTETLGSGAVVELADPHETDDDAGASEESLPAPGRDPEGFLPYSKTAAHVETGDRLRVQVAEPSAPWTNGRPVLDTTVRVRGTLATLVRGGTGGETGGGKSGSGRTTGTTGQPDLASVLPADPPDGWGLEWAPAADDADLDALGAALDRASERAASFDAALEDAEPPADAAPACYWPGSATAWVWFGRESRAGLDEARRTVTETMAGHHRVKAGSERASAAVDFVEAVCPGGSADADFPFDAVTGQFGPREGDTVRIDHGKPDGRCLSLGEGTVTGRDPDGTVVVEREMSGRGSYDGLDVPQHEGDVAVTKLTEGKWWYPTVYRGADGERRGTYVNVCTPVEVFPRAVRYVDLHVDVVQHADGRVERVDDDELDAAVDAGYVPLALAEQARSVAAAVENAL